MEQLKYEYRADGNFLVRRNCWHCGKEWDAYALSNCRYYCPACTQVFEWEIAPAPDAGKGGDHEG